MIIFMVVLLWWWWWYIGDEVSTVGVVPREERQSNQVSRYILMNNITVIIPLFLYKMWAQNRPSEGPPKADIPAWKRALLEKREAKRSCMLLCSLLHELQWSFPICRSDYPPNSPLVPSKREEKRSKYDALPEWKKKLILQKQSQKS